MALIENIPATIADTENMATKQVVTSEHWNNRINQLITQGNLTAEAVQALQDALATEIAAENLGAKNQDGTPTNIQSVINTLFDIAAGAGNMPFGGTPGQIIKKTGVADFQAGWENITAEDIPEGAISKVNLDESLVSEIDGKAFAPIIGEVPPTTSTVGGVGQFYLDTSDKTLYQCIDTSEEYVWHKISFSPKVGDRVTEASKLSSGRFIPCNGQLIDESYRPALRGFISAHEFCPFNGYGGQSVIGAKGATAYNNVIMAANDSMFVVVAGAGNRDWFNYNYVSPSISEQDRFTIFSSPDPDKVNFASRAASSSYEGCIGAGYDKDTSLFWVASLYGVLYIGYNIKVRYSADGITWDTVTSESAGGAGHSCGLASPVAKGGQLVFVTGGLAAQGQIFDLQTKTFRALAWPVTASAALENFYVSEDGQHFAFYYSNTVYTTANSGVSWAQTTTMPSFTDICYSPTCGWIALSGSSNNVYRAPEGGGVWTSVTTVPSRNNYEVLHALSDGRVYLYSSGTGTPSQCVLKTTTDGTTFVSINISQLFGIATSLISSQANTIMKEIDGKLLLGTKFNASGTYSFALFEGEICLDTAEVKLDSGFGSIYSSLCFTHDPVSNICHFIFGTNASSTDTVGNCRIKSVSLQVVNNRLILEKSIVEDSYNFPEFSVPYTHTTTGTVFTSNVVSTVYFRFVGHIRNSRACDGVVCNNPAMAINFKGDWKAFSSRIAGDTTAGKYINFYIIGSSFCARYRDGMYLCIEED